MEEHRGEQAGFIACLLRVHHSEAAGALPAIEKRGLRKALLGETKLLMWLRGVEPGQDINTDRLVRLWGKTRRGSISPDDFHPALFHMLDVGNVARELLGEHGSPRWQRALSDALGADAEKLAEWLPYFVALHDIGKLSAAFQSLDGKQLARLRREGFLLDPQNIPHAHITQIYLEETLTRVFEGRSSKVQLFSESLGGHHGRFAHPDMEIKKGRRRLSAESEEWNALRQAVDALLRNEFLKRDTESLTDAASLSTGIMALTGFVILCDWLGSDERYFPPEPNAPLSAYFEESREGAHQATLASGLLASAWSEAPTQTEMLLADLLPLRSLQLAIDDIPDSLLQAPSLTIIEAPTGEGKTEAALALAHRISRRTATDEFYYALPTMATSNQMFERLQAHLQERLRLDTSAKLVHGQAFLIEEDLRAASIRPLENGSDKPEASDSAAWFNSKKRALLAPFGVGTIDQAELAALNVKHAALRMMGLVGKMVIVDEVHAYDTYMTTIVERLLNWLASMNTSVILLSATLPKSRRDRLIQAYGVKMIVDEEQANAYPSLLMVSEKGTHQASPRPWQPHRVIELQELHLGDEQAEEKAQWLFHAVSGGGAVCWITNTVKRAQRVFSILRKDAPPDVDLELLHSQFPLDERQKREDSLKNKYGRSGNRPPTGKGIVVGTQVLEQSLDLDFDAMVSDLAPIDLLLQRAGRLHRHDRDRPALHSTPRLWLNFVVTPEGDLQLGTDRTIYDEFIMRQTHRTLVKRAQFRLPIDYRGLIEAVYADEPPSVDDPLHDAWLELQAKQEIASGEARERLLPAPHPRDSFAKTAALRVKFEEDENRADWVVAKTRLGERTLSVIPLEREGDLVTLPDTNEKITVQAEASHAAQRRLLRRQLRISNQTAIDEVQSEAEQEATQLFTQSALLKGFYPLWLKAGEKVFKTERGALRVTLDPQLGLVVEKESKVYDTDE